MLQKNYIYILEIFNFKIIYSKLNSNFALGDIEI